MVYCCVPYCKSRSGKSKGISFHDFPCDRLLKQKWLIAIARKNFSPNTESYTQGVCSLHFQESDYKPGLKRRCLKPSVIPSIFPGYPAYMVPKVKPARKATNRSSKTPLHKSDSSAGEIDQRKAQLLTKSTMVKSCCVVGCTNRFSKGAGLGFFNFPLDTKKRALWILALRRKNWTPSPYSLVCGKHFQTGRPNPDESHPDYVPNRFFYSKSKVKKTVNHVSTKEHYNGKSIEGKTNKKGEENSKTLKPAAMSHSFLPVQPTDNKDPPKIKILYVQGNDVRYSTMPKPSEGRIQDTVKQSAADKCGRQDHMLDGLDYSLVNSNINHSGKYDLKSVKVNVKLDKSYEEEINCEENDRNAETFSEESNQEEEIFEEITEEQKESSECDQESEEDSDVLSSTSKTSPYEISKRVEAFGRLVTHEMNTLCKNPALYLKAQQNILKVLIETQSELISSEL